jgi:hypothetical protein
MPEEDSKHKFIFCGCLWDLGLFFSLLFANVSTITYLGKLASLEMISAKITQEMIFLKLVI